MNPIRTATFLLALGFSGGAMADQAARVEAEKLLDTMGMQQSLDATIGLVLDAQIEQTPELAPMKGVMKEFFAKYMSYQSLKPDLIGIYEAEFTSDELKQINAFYATPVGRKTVEKIPLLMNKGGELGARRVQEHLPELEAMVRAELEKNGAAVQDPNSLPAKQ